MTQIKNWVEGNFAPVLLVTALLGLLLPSIGEVPNHLVAILIGFLVFFACPGMKRDEFMDVDVFQIGLFTVMRFAIFPVVLFYAANAIVPDYAQGILLLALMPAAMAVASLCSLSGGRVALGLSLTVISSFLAPAFVPSIFSFLGHFVEVNAIGLFITLALVVFVPFLIYFFAVVRVPIVKTQIDKSAKIGSILVMALVLFVIISSYKSQFFSDMGMFVEGMGIMMVTFFLCYLFGFVFSLFVPQEQRSSYIVASGAMNNGLAIGLAFLYFSPQVTFFILLSEIAWCIYIAAVQWYFSRNAAS